MYPTDHPIPAEIAARVERTVRALDRAREREPHSPLDYAGQAVRLAEHLAAIEALSNLWADLTGEFPSPVDIARSASASDGSLSEDSANARRKAADV